jgi:hypothetical protein
MSFHSFINLIHFEKFRCKKVRTLNGVPQPTSVCPVGEYNLAVLCKREIRVIDLNEGRFKVRKFIGEKCFIILTLVTNQKIIFNFLFR